MDLRASLSEITFPASQADVAHRVTSNPWIMAASVLTHFDPLELRSARGGLEPLAPEMTELLDASTNSRANRNARRLRTGVRRQALEALGTPDAMKAQLALNPPPDHPTQVAFRALLDGREGTAALIRSGDPVVLAALTEAMGWVEGLLPDLPDPAEIAQALARARLLMPMRRLVGEHFAGREDVLAEIARHLELAPEGTILMLQGPGGVGKSTVLAKFILDAVEGAPSPPTVIMLNLDNPELVIDDPFTLLQESGRQLRIQHPELNPKLDEMRDYIASLQRRSRSMDALESVSGGTVDWDAVGQIAREVVRIVPGNAPILLVIDTFEEAQATGPSAVARLMQLVDSLKAGNPRLSVVIAGRAEQPLPNQRILTMGALDPVSARAVLEKAARMQPLPDAVADEVLAITRGNPLATHLAGSILAAEGTDIFHRDKDLARLLGQIRTEQVQAQLYGRVLSHIAHPDVRRLAYPGLVLRRITPAILRLVLAGPCGVAIHDDAEAGRLFELFRSEVALVETEGDGSLRYREDVRSMIVTDLRADQPELTSAIDWAAIEYYRGQPGVIARAEELYHLLASGAPEFDLDLRWEPGVEPYLATAGPELPPQSQVWLANRLGNDLRPDQQQAADQQGWETSAEQTARLLLRDNLPEDALSVLNQRAARQPGSPLFLTEAEALTLLGQPATALEIIEAGTISAEQAGERLLTVNLRLLEALIHEKDRQWQRAGTAAADAHRIAGRMHNDRACLRSIATLLRLHRRTDLMQQPKPDALVAEAEAIIDASGLEALYDAPGIMRELAAELGARNPMLLSTALRVSGAYVTLPVMDVTAGAGQTDDASHPSGAADAPTHPTDIKAAALISDPRAKAILDDMNLSEGAQIDLLSLIGSAYDPEQRFALITLAAELLALDLDRERGLFSPTADQRTPWREIPLDPLEQSWAELSKAAY